MEKFESGEIILISFPYSDLTGTKTRPSLVLLDCGDMDVVVASITSKEARGDFDLPLHGWQQAGLAVPSVVRLNKLFTTSKRSVVRRMGVLIDRDKNRVGEVLQKYVSSFLTA